MDEVARREAVRHHFSFFNYCRDEVMKQSYLQLILAAIIITPHLSFPMAVGAFTGSMIGWAVILYCEYRNK